jgi:hypothetical protein
MSAMRQHLPDWVTALEGECQVQGYEDQIEHQPSRSERCLTATCDKWENGKSISSIDTGRASIEHGAKIDSDLARIRRRPSSHAASWPGYSHSERSAPRVLGREACAPKPNDSE